MGYAFPFPLLFCFCLRLMSPSSSSYMLTRRVLQAQLAMTSPYAFPTLTLSTLHALPTPVPRRGQKVCKPVWFDMHTKELEALGGVGDVLGWLGRGVDVSRGHDPGHLGEDDEEADEASSSMSVGRWTYANVATELGGWLGTLDRCGGGAGPVGSVKPQSRSLPQPPRTHRLFSYLPWSFGVAGGESTLGENDEDGLDVNQGGGEDDVRLPGSGVRGEEEQKGWLEDDDIEEVE